MFLFTVKAASLEIINNNEQECKRKTTIICITVGYHFEILLFKFPPFSSFFLLNPAILGLF